MYSWIPLDGTVLRLLREYCVEDFVMLGLGCAIDQDVIKVHYNISGLEMNRFIPAVNSLFWKNAWNLLNEIGVHPQIIEFVVAIDFSHDAE